jgi:hypothetical protein
VIVAWCAAAWAGPADPWLGTWGLDPSVSDDPAEQLKAAVTAPIVTGSQAARMAPDGGATATSGDDERTHALDDALDLLGTSGGIALRTTGEDLAVEWTGEAPIPVALDRHWVKVEREPRRWKVRAWMDGPNLVVERRQRATSVAETFLPAQRPGEVVVVVWVEAPTLHPPVEFRRVYRAIDPNAAPVPPAP